MKQSLKTPGSLDSIKNIAEFVLETAKQAGLDKTVSYRLRLAVDEIATNIVNYGYEKAGLSGDIEVLAELTQENLIIIVQDSASPFDPNTAPPPDDPATPADLRKQGGWGVHFAINAVDEFHYERVGKYNRNIFIVKRKSD